MMLDYPVPSSTSLQKLKTQLLIDLLFCANMKDLEEHGWKHRFLPNMAALTKTAAREETRQYKCFLVCLFETVHDVRKY